MIIFFAQGTKLLNFFKEMGFHDLRRKTAGRIDFVENNEDHQMKD